jgi:hypothetical protein
VALVVAAGGVGGQVTGTTFAACPMCAIPMITDRPFRVEGRMEVRRCLWCNGIIEVGPHHHAERDVIEAAIEEMLKPYLDGERVA